MLVDFFPHIYGSDDLILEKYELRFSEIEKWIYSNNL